MKKLGAEVILTVMALPFVVWTATSIFSLEAKSGIDKLEVTIIKQMLEKQDKKIDNITDILINKGK